MLLAIDIGNTNLVIGCVHDDKILFKARICLTLQSKQFCSQRIDNRRIQLLICQARILQNIQRRSIIALLPCRL